MGRSSSHICSISKPPTTASTRSVVSQISKASHTCIQQSRIVHSVAAIILTPVVVSIASYFLYSLLVPSGQSLAGLNTGSHAAGSGKSSLSLAQFCTEKEESARDPDEIQKNRSPNR